MDRSGHPLDDTIFSLYKHLYELSNLKCHGLHVYDGHLRTPDFETRKHEVETGFVDVQHFIESIEEAGLPKPIIIAGGTRVITKPKKGISTIDMGHKAVAAENPIDKRIRFLNLENYEFIGQSEEHGVIQVSDWEGIKVGDVLYGVPYHVCPTVNLYDEAYVVENQSITDTWQVLGRKRKITV